VYRRVFIIGLIILFAGYLPALKNRKVEKADIFRTGEQLIYKVKYLFLRIGTLRLLNEGPVEIEGKTYFKLKIFIDSSPGIPFITIHDIYESYVDSNAVPVAFYAWERKGDHTLKTDYLFDYELQKARVIIQKIYSDRTELVEDQEIVLDQVYRDVLSLLFYARKMSGQNARDIPVPTFVLGGRDSCYFREVGVVKEVDHLGRKKSSFYVEGRVKFIGIAGVKDDFQGWFSLDAQRVPLKAKMKAFFGSVIIELEDSRNWLAANR